MVAWQVSASQLGNTEQCTWVNCIYVHISTVHILTVQILTVHILAVHISTLHISTVHISTVYFSNVYFPLYVAITFEKIIQLLHLFGFRMYFKIVSFCSSFSLTDTEQIPCKFSKTWNSATHKIINRKRKNVSEICQKEPMIHIDKAETKPNTTFCV